MSEGWVGVHDVIERAREEETQAMAGVKSRVTVTRPHECAFCGEGFETIESRSVHTQIAHKNIVEGKGIPCAIGDCPRQFDDNARVSAHRQREHAVTAKEARDRGLPFSETTMRNKPVTVAREEHESLVPGSETAEAKTAGQAAREEQVPEPEPLRILDRPIPVTATERRTELWEDSEARYDRTMFGFRALYVRALIRHTFEACGKDAAPGVGHVSPELLDRLESLLWKDYWP